MPAVISATPLVDQLALGGFFAMTLYAALCDAARFRIPNLTSIVIIALFPLHVLASPAAVAWWPSLAVAASVFGVGLVMFARGWVGGGDVKFLGAVSLWAGPALLLPLLMIMSLGGGLLAMGALAAQSLRQWRTQGVLYLSLTAPRAIEPKIPYGVAIAAGAIYVGMKLLIR